MSVLLTWVHIQSGNDVDMGTYSKGSPELAFFLSPEAPGSKALAIHRDILVVAIYNLIFIGKAVF